VFVWFFLFRPKASPAKSKLCVSPYCRFILWTANLPSDSSDHIGFPRTRARPLAPDDFPSPVSLPPLRQVRVPRRGGKVAGDRQEINALQLPAHGPSVVGGSVYFAFTSSFQQKGTMKAEAKRKKNGVSQRGFQSKNRPAGR